MTNKNKFNFTYFYKQYERCYGDLPKPSISFLECL